MTYRVEKSNGWSVTAPGGRRWSGAPSQSAAFQLANSLAAIDVMLGRLAQPASVPRRLLAGYGCYRIPGRAVS